MNKNFLARLWLQAWSLILVEMSRQELGWLLWTRHHLSLLTTRRTMMIVSRVRLVAGVFAVLTPLWILVDIYAFEQQVWTGLVVARLAATAAFFSLLRLPNRMDTLGDAYKALAMLLAIPSAFFLFSYQHMAGLQLHGVQEAFAVGYAFLPFVMLAGLSVFPLTLVECLVCAAPILLSQAVTSLLGSQVFDWPTAAASFWLLLLITGVSAMAGISQLGFIIVLMREAVRDSLTGCFSRRSGEELLALQFGLAERQQGSLAMAFIDLDHFKGINDGYGHDAGDQALRDAAAAIRDQARATDVLIRWGGEEFLLLMPGTDLPGARIALERLRSVGLGTRPDGMPLTASIGVAERAADGTASWQDLIATADGRMYQAKQGGRDRIIG